MEDYISYLGWNDYIKETIACLKSMHGIVKHEINLVALKEYVEQIKKYILILEKGINRELEESTKPESEKLDKMMRNALTH